MGHRGRYVQRLLMRQELYSLLLLEKRNELAHFGLEQQGLQLR